MPIIGRKQDNIAYDRKIKNKTLYLIDRFIGGNSRNYNTE